MYQALAAGETLPEVEVKWYRTSTEGKQEHFFTTKLEDATIVNINTALAHAQDPSKAEYTFLTEKLTSTQESTKPGQTTQPMLKESMRMS
nr:type VI secretion system tube protein Hcp [Burkholderia lata]